MGEVIYHSDGLNYGSMDVTTPEEIQAFREFFAKSRGHSLASDFYLEFRPDVVKRARKWTYTINCEEEITKYLVQTLAILHHYAILGFEGGIIYEIRRAQFGGATKAEILDTLAVSALHGHGLGGHAVGSAALDYLRNYEDPPPQDRWPPLWSFDPGAFESGVDFSDPVATRDDIEKIQDWYQTRLGEVPRYVRMMAKYRPKMLKAYRDRYEHAIRDALPKQMMPFMLLGYCTMAGHRDGIREAILLGRSFGMTKGQLTGAIFWGIYGSPENFSLVDEVAGDILQKID